jgi:F0F1-type ATP synthase assembly protein I
MIQKILTPIIHCLIATVVVGLPLVFLTDIRPGPVLWAIMAFGGLLGFISGVVRVRHPRPTDKT